MKLLLLPSQHGKYIDYKHDNVNMSVFSKLESSKKFRMEDLVSEGRGQTISYGMLYSPAAEMYVYFLDKDEEISEMKAPYENIVLMLKGSLRLWTEPPVDISAGDVYIVPEETDVVITATKPVKYVSILLPMEGTLIKNLDLSTKMVSKEMVAYREGQVVNLTLVNSPSLNLSVISMDKGEGLNTHTAPGDAFVVALDGEGQIIIDGKEFRLKEGESIIMPKNVPHAVMGITQFKMILILVKEGKKPIMPT